MPLPLILAGVIGASAALASKKAYDGYQDNSRAEEIFEQAQRDYNLAKESVENSQKMFNNRTEELGQYQLAVGQKFETFEKMATQLFEKLGESDPNERKIQVGIPSHKLDKVHAFSMSASAFATGLATGAILGGATAFAVYQGVITFATASTGTAIASLSGVALENAIFAAIGGGAISAGGLGMAAGRMLLGGVTVAPTLAMMAFSYASSAEENLEKAQKMRDEAVEIIKKCDGIKAKFDYANSYVESVHKALSEMDHHFDAYYDDIKKMHDLVIESKILDEETRQHAIRNMSQEIKIKVQNGLGIAACMTEIMVTPLFKLSEENNELLTDDNNIPLINQEIMDKQISKQQQFIDKYI